MRSVCVVILVRAAAYTFFFVLAVCAHFFARILLNRVLMVVAIGRVYLFVVKRVHLVYFGVYLNCV